MAIDTGNLRDKPWYYGVGIGAFLAAVIVGLFYYLLITGFNEDLERLDGRLTELQQEIQTGRSAQQRLPQLREEAERLEGELEKLRRILPSSRNTEELIKKFKSLVDEGNFVLQRLVFPTLTERTGGEDGAEEVYAEWPITVSLEGNYHDLAVLFAKLANFSRIINVEQFTISALPVQIERTIKADFVAKTFVYREPAEEAEDGDGKPGGNE
ncbi:MAG: type 4a pilus biogenesis protein PilO [Thermoanaerobaculia bacterium]